MGDRRDAYRMVTVYCPRCDKPFTRASKVAAMNNMEEHLRNNHPEYNSWQDLT